MQNVFYFLYLLSLLTQCNVQYVGETTLPLHRTINLHRRVKSACEYVIKNVKDVCVGASFSVQIIEIFYGLDTRITSVSS